MLKDLPTLPVLLRRIAILATVTLGVGSVLSGCAGFHREQRAQWRNDAESSCMKSGRVKPTQHVKVSKAIDGPGVCGANYPIKVSALEAPVSPDLAQNGNLILTSANLMLTSITPTATLSCPMVGNVDDWLAQDVQAAAITWFGQPMIELVTFGTFSCRPMNNRTGAQLSEHSFANAIDVKAFRFADGRLVSVAKGWRGAPEEQGFLRETLFGACNRFSTVLGPGSDALHYDHFHLDLARHRSGRRICKPRVEMPQPPVSTPQAYENRPMASAEPVYKPDAGPRIARPAPLMPPSTLTQAAPAARPLPVLSGQDIAQTGNPGIEVEDYTDEQNFEGKFFDITGSVRAKDDPPVVRQRPGPPRRQPSPSLSRSPTSR